MARVRVSLRLRFLKLVDTDDERIFRDDLVISDPDAVGFQDLSSIIERKLAFMEMPQSDFTVFFLEPASGGDRVVVDDAYVLRLVHQWWKEARAQKRPRSSHRRPSSEMITTEPRRLDGDTAAGLLLLGSEENDRLPSDWPGVLDESVLTEDTDVVYTVSATFDIELRQLHRTRRGLSDTALVEAQMKKNTSSSGGDTHATSCVPLTVANLNQWEQCALPSRPGVDSAAEHTAAQHPSSSTPPAAAVSSGSVHFIPIGQLTCPPPAPGSWAVRCVVLVMRCKGAKVYTGHTADTNTTTSTNTTTTVMELDLCDAAIPEHHITAVTFDASVQRELMSRLRDGGRYVVEIRGAYVRRKNAIDIRFQTNTHPLLLRLDRSSRIELVQILPVPLMTASAPTTGTPPQPAAHDAVVRVRNDLTSGGVIDLHRLVRARTPTGVTHLSPHTPAHLGAPRAVPSEVHSSSHHSHRGGFMVVPGHTLGAVTNSNEEVGRLRSPHPSLGVAASACTSSSSSSAATRRTTFRTNALSAAAVPALLGQALREQQTRYLAESAAQAARAEEEQRPHEPGVCHITQRTLRQRERLLQAYTDRTLDRKSRIRRRVEEVDPHCLLCGLDSSGNDDAALMAEVTRLLRASHRNRGSDIPTPAVLRRALADTRGVPAGATPTRLHCRAHFVQLSTRSVHQVHPRCAHLCTRYQRGEELEDIVMYELPMQMCALCGLAGATVQCYHPRCEEQYHVVCALYSRGYVNFGKKDPYLPCPACPRHTLVSLRPRSESDVLHVDHSCWEDGVAFDSRVVESTDLRDPDENEGE